jgi:general secretion pathway protein D
VTLDNEEAEIVVGQNVPFVTGSYSNTGGGTTPTNPFQTIERQDVGLTLKIKPQINEGDAIKLDVSQEVSSVSPSSVGASDIVTNKRSIKTSVMVDDGNVIVLGGLIQDDLKESQQKVPGLGDIPLLGWLFRYRKTTKVKTNLMVFLRPTIIRDKQTALDLTSGKYNYIRAQQLQQRERGIYLMDNKVAPLLPDFKEFLKLPPPYEQSKERLELSEPPPDVSMGPGPQRSAETPDSPPPSSDLDAGTLPQ